MGFASKAENSELNDSAQAKKVERSVHIKSTARLHTKGMFAYGGRICADNPAFDINFIYDRKKWGFLFYKAIDLTNHTSLNNFTLAVFYKNFNLNNRITFTPYVGTFLEQPHTFADHGSDIAAIAITSLKLNSNFSVDHTALFGNLIIEPELLDWVNRLRLVYSAKHLDITSTLWHNNRVFDKCDYTSVGLAIAYSRIPLSDHLNLSVGLTDLVMVQTSDEQSIPKSNKLMVTLAAQFSR